MVDLDKKSVSAGLYFCCGLIGGLAMLCASFGFSVLSRNACYDLKNGYSDLVDSWDSDRIYDITSNPNYALPSSDYYVKSWSGLWPGTMEGCYCSVSNRRKRVTQGLKTRDCNSNETSVGCIDIDSTPRRELLTWVNGETLLTVRIKGTSFLNTYNKIDSQGNCQGSGFINCGDKSSKSKGSCLPSKYGKCPLTDLTNTATTGYNSTAFSGFTLYTSNAQTKNPLAEAYIRQSHLCFIRSNMPNTPGRYRYPLFLGDYSSCREDKTVWSVGEAGEKSFYDKNGIKSYYTRLTEYDISDVYKVKLLVARGLEWSPDCSDTVPVMTSKKDDLVKVYDDYKNVIIIYSIAFALSVITIFAQGWFGFFHQHKKFFKLLFVSRVLWFIMALPPVVIAFSKTRDFIKFFDKIQSLSCSNDETNTNFANFSNSVKDNLGYKAGVMLGLLIANFAADALFVPLMFWNVFPKDYSDTAVSYPAPAANPPSIATVSPGTETAPLKPAPAQLAKPPVVTPPPAPVTPVTPAPQNDAWMLDNKAQGGKPLVLGNTQDPVLPPGFLEANAPKNELPPGFLHAQLDKERKN